MAETVKYLREITGGTAPELVSYVVGATAVKKGDPVKIGATQALVIPITAAGDTVVGVAEADAAIGASILIRPVTAYSLFRIQCASTKKYVDATDRLTTADFTVFTSGAMQIDPATDSSHSVLMYQLNAAAGVADNTAQNYVECIFNVRRF
jgi:hypothetical protein